MQTTKFLVVIGAAAALLVPAAVVASPDTEAQAKLREAMRQQLEALNNQATPAAEPVAPPAPRPMAVEPAPIPRPATVVVPVPVETIPAMPQTESGFSEVGGAGDAKNDQLLQALRAKLAEDKASAPAAPVFAEPVAPAAPSKPAPAIARSAPAPVVSMPITANMEAPALPLSGTKQNRLAELLRRYKLDDITPQEYHTARAKILAE